MDSHNKVVHNLTAENNKKSVQQMMQIIYMEL